MTGCDAYRLRLSSDKAQFEMRRPKSDDLEHGAQAVVIGRSFEHTTAAATGESERESWKAGQGSRGRWKTRVWPAFRERKIYSRHDLHYFSSCIAGSLLTLVPEDLGQVQVGSQHYYLNIRSKQQNLKVLAFFNLRKHVNALMFANAKYRCNYYLLHKYVPSSYATGDWTGIF